VNFDDVQTASLNQFSRQSERYGKGHILQNIEDVALALQTIPFRMGAKALDVATGGGHTGLYLAFKGYDVTLADIAQPMLDRAAEAARERGLAVKTALHAAELFPYPDESFDLVTCRVAAHHFSSPEKFIAETARVLKRGGHFLLIDGTVSDDQAEAQAWIHDLEKLRDPSHQRFLTPKEWETLCQARGLTLKMSNVIPFKQPDLNWYFETAATPDENRIKVLEMVARAPESARSLFRLAEEEGKIVWWWQRLTLIAAK
jgi:ubiquinone/menaquinone biosynthesis C-methylase UbiE